MKLFVFVSLLVSLAIGSQYYSVDEYLQKHPHQKALMERFDALVQSDAVAIDTEHKKVKIAMLYPGGQIGDYWRRSQKSFEARMQELGIDYEIESIFVDETDELGLRRSLLKLLKNESDYLIFTLNISGHQKLISQLIHNQRQKIILQNITTPLKEWEGVQPFMYVGFDHIEGTKLLAGYFKRHQKEGANYLMLYHTQGYVSQMRGDSFIEMVQDTHRLKGAYYTDVDKERAKAFVVAREDIKSIDYIYSCSTDIAIGVSEALQALGLHERISINGWGGGSAELDMIEAGVMDVTVMRMNDDNGVAMAEAIRLDILGKPVPLIYSGHFKLVDKTLDQERIEAYKKRAFRYSQ